MGDPGQLVYEQDVDSDGSTVDLSEVRDSRVEEILEVIRTGDAYRLDELLTKWQDSGWDVPSCRDSRGLSLYVTAIEGGFLGKAHQVFLNKKDFEHKYDIYAVIKTVR